MAVGSYGDQALQLRTLLPASPVYRVVNEQQIPTSTSGYDARIGQSRLEIDSSGSADSYFINVLHPRDGSEANLTANLVDGDTYWDIVLTDPQLGTATVRVNKGMTSAGGSATVRPRSRVRNKRNTSTGSASWRGITGVFCTCSANA